MSQSKKSSSFPSKRAAQLVREILETRQRIQALLQSPTGNWYQQMANKEIRDPAPEKETFPGTVIGYRAFGVRIYPEWNQLEYRLHPVGRTEMPSWTPGWNQAQCAMHNDTIVSHGPVPSRLCGCGFWAFYHPQDLGPGFSISCDVGAVIEGAGRVYLHTEGFRAERARVKALFALKTVPTGVDLTAAAAYGVDFYHSRSLAEKVFPPTNPEDFGITPEPQVGVVDLASWRTPSVSGWGSPPNVPGFSVHSHTGRIRFH